MNISSQNEIVDMVNNIRTHTKLFNESQKKPYNINFSIRFKLSSIMKLIKGNRNVFDPVY